MTLSTIEALESAIEMLKAVASGKQYGRAEYMDRLHDLVTARDRHRRQETADAAHRDNIRALADKLRKPEPSYGFDLGAEATVQPGPDFTPRAA